MKTHLQVSIAVLIIGVSANSLFIEPDVREVSGPANTVPRAVSLCGTPGARTILAIMDTTRQMAPLLTTLGNYKMIVTTANPRAQQFFSQGINLYYGFNHLESYRSFREAARLDPDFAMAYWGQALALGPNINLPMDPADANTVHDAVRKAISLYDKLPEREKMLIDALSKRYTAPAPEDRKPLDEAYATAMAAVAARFPDDPDVNTLYAEALMDLHPWDFYKKGVPQPWTAEPVGVIARVLTRHPSHPGANHLNIHILEASANPGRATASADKLRTLVPGSGHLVHMPSHIYIRTGRYIDGILANEKAVKVDKDYIETCKVQGVYPLFYYPHNYHFLWACAQMSGQRAKSLDAAAELVKTVNTGLMAQKDFAGLQHLYTSPWYTMIRFGLWNEIMTIPEPADSLIYAKGVWHYARGTAFARLNKIGEAEAELEKLKTLNTKPEMEEFTIGGFNSFRKVLSIGALVLEGQIHAEQEDYVEAVELLQSAIEIEDDLLYQEPPDWFLPVRQILGNVLLRSHQDAAAEEVFRADLAIYPENGWSLSGLARSLEAQGKMSEAAKVRKQFKKAFSHSDILVTAPVY